MIGAYPKILNFGQPYIKDIFDGEVTVEEKLDGSQTSWLNFNGDLIFRSKGKIQQIECPDKLFSQGIEYLKSIIHKIPENIQLYAEYLKSPKHNVIAYDRIPKNHFMLFGIVDKNTQTFISDRGELERYADLLEIDPVPLIYKGRIESAEQLKNFLNRDSFCGGAKIEGVVVKNYNKNLILGGQVIPIMCGKYVSEAFKEVHQRTWKKENTGKGKWETFKDGYKTEARWLKAIQYLRDSGELELNPKDIGKIMKRINIDIIEEEKEVIKDFLWKEFGSEVLKSATRGVPEFYKEWLLNQNFGE